MSDRVAMTRSIASSPVTRLMSSAGNGANGSETATVSFSSVFARATMPCLRANGPESAPVTTSRSSSSGLILTKRRPVNCAYDSVPNFFKFPPNIYFGEGIGVATNSKGHVFVYTRSGETRLFEFDQNGNYVKEWGQGLYGFAFAHAVRVDPQDNVWAVDEGTNMVIKFNPQGRVVLVLGRRQETVNQLADLPGQGAYTGANKTALRNRPTDVAWDKDGNIFASDGYGY